MTLSRFHESPKRTCDCTDYTCLQSNGRGYLVLVGLQGRLDGYDIRTEAERQTDIQIWRDGEEGSD